MNQADILNLLKNQGYDDGYVYKIVDGGELTGKFEDFITKLIELVAQDEAKVREELIARYDSLQSQYAELSVALDSAQHEIAEILEMVDDLPELNTSNYNHDDVCDLNSKVCNLVLAIRTRNKS